MPLAGLKGLQSRAYEVKGAARLNRRLLGRQGSVSVRNFDEVEEVTMRPYLGLRAARLWTLGVLSLLLCSGCLSPAAIRPVAEDNATNVVNLGRNAITIGAALRAEVAFHGELQVHQARSSVFAALTELAKQSLPSKEAATASVLSNENKPWYTWFDGEVKKVAGKLSATSGAGRAELVATLAERHPVVLDAALADRAFSYLRIFLDAAELVDVNKKISAETDPDVRRALMVARSRIAEPYLAVKQAREQVDAYLVALDEYLGVVAEQVGLASNHAAVFLEFADAKPTLESVQDLVSNEQLRGEVLGLVESRKGPEFAGRLRNSLEKYDQASEVLSDPGGI
jgi:hypothetical protein